MDNLRAKTHSSSDLPTGALTCARATDSQFDGY
jgi:hypothetical protein